MQQGARTNWEEYTRAYAEFIRTFDRPNVVGYMEMDVDQVIGYDHVLKLREILYRKSGCPDKIIPVWHKNRGIDDYLKMCADHKGRTVAVTGFRNEDIKDRQYPLFVNEAHKAGARIHGLGLARRNILETVPFDYADAASWAMNSMYGTVQAKKVDRNQSFSKTERSHIWKQAYKEGMKQQRHFYRRWARLQP